MSLTSRQIKRLVLHSQGVARPGQFGRGVNAVSRALKQLHYVQIDTISVVERAHQHVLRTRVPDYRETHLNRLFEAREVFEYWSHAAAYLPMADYRYYLPIMEGYRKKQRVDPKLASGILERLHREGPLQSRDFEDSRQHKSTGWWDWKPAKVAMEHLFRSGEIMVTERRGFQKVYDLRERVLPTGICTDLPTDEELGEFYVTRMLNALGFARAMDIAYARTVPSRWAGLKVVPLVKEALERLEAAGEVTRVSRTGADYFFLDEALQNLPARMGRRRVVFLSPFDNLVINRDRLEDLFDFSYQLECYVPAAKRNYGYFTQPILWGDEFVGRIDCKAHRKEGILVVNNLWLEAGIDPGSSLCQALAEALCQYRDDLGCTRIRVDQTDNRALKRQLIRAIDAG